jgi:hypothetical protein
MLVLSFAAALLGSAVVRAEQPAATQMERWSAEKILPPEPGRKACWRRVYDAKHLAAHRQQKVTELTFFLRVSGYDAGGGYVFKNPDHIFYNFAISLKRRGNKRALVTSGDCLGEKTVECVVDCDSGGVTIDKLPATACQSVSKTAASPSAATAPRRPEPGSSPEPTTRSFTSIRPRWRRARRLRRNSSEAGTTSRGDDGPADLMIVVF